MTTAASDDAVARRVRPDPARAHLVDRPVRRRAATDFQAAPPVVGSGTVPDRRLAARDLGTVRPQPRLLGQAPVPRRGASSGSIRIRPRWLRHCERGDIDYARGIAPDGRRSRSTRRRTSSRSRARATGFTHLAFNTYATPIDGGGAVDLRSPRPHVPRCPGVRARSRVDHRCRRRWPRDAGNRR